MDLSLNQQTLWYAALYKDPSAPVDYKLSATSKTLLKYINTEKEKKDLLAEFNQKPTETLSYCRKALQHIARDQRLSDRERQDRIKRYVKQYLDMIIKLDQSSFPHDATKVLQWVPSYIPDKFVDMWSDYILADQHRVGREKITIDKTTIFADAAEVLTEILSHPTMLQWEIVNRLYYYVAKQPYSQATIYANNRHSIPLDHFVKNDGMVCRHKALLFQVLAQACGIWSQLLKCDLSFGNGHTEAHAANIVSLDNKLFLVDATNPLKTKTWDVYYAITPITEHAVNTNTNRYTWTINSDKLTTSRTYVSRNNMYYQMR